MKNAIELYNILAGLEVGQSLCTYYKRMEYRGTLEEMLQQQGYKKGIDYATAFDNKTCQHFITRLEDIKPYEKPLHDFEIGDVLVSAWGYDQTNVDFYQVTDKTDKTVTIREIGSRQTLITDMTGEAVPLIDNFVGEPMRKTPKLWGEWQIPLTSYSNARLWTGGAEHFSNYC